MNLLKNSVLNVSGYLIPGLLSIPILGYMSRTLGVEEFGYFSIIMAVVGYASIFDVGITRSIIREVAIHENNDEEVSKILSTSILIVGFLSSLVAIIVLLLSYEIANYLKVSSHTFNMFVSSINIVAISIPIFLITQVFISLLEGKQEFGRLNIYKTISGILVVLLPAFALIISKTLLSAVIGLLCSRILSMILVFYYSKNHKIKFKFNYPVFKRLLSFGGWIAISNIISPIMSYFDRFILSNQIGGQSVGYYTAPSEAISRLGILPSAIARTIFPMISNQSSNLTIKNHAYILVAGTMIPIGILFIYFSSEILTLWLGVNYAGKSSKIFQVLMLGLVLNAFAQIPFTSIQAKGLSKITAYIHLIEFIPYLLLLFFLIQHYGLIGVAWAWTFRMFLDLVVLVFFDEYIKIRY